MTVGLGITSYQRPAFLEKCVKAIGKSGAFQEIDHLYVYDDGSDSRDAGAFKRAQRPLEALGGTWIASEENHGCAYAKNRLLERMLEDGCTWLFLCEDDIRVQSAEAVTEYIRICQDQGFAHLSFAHHGPANLSGPVEVAGDVAYYPHSIGAFTIFSRECLQDVGLFDENFQRAWEHVEHELRLIQAGYMPSAGVHHFPDALWSEKWLAEFPGSIEKSSIRPRPDWQMNIRNGLRYWATEKPDTYKLLFGEGMPLHEYANGILVGNV